MESMFRNIGVAQSILIKETIFNPNPRFSEILGWLKAYSQWIFPIQWRAEKGATNRVSQLSHSKPSCHRLYNMFPTSPIDVFSSASRKYDQISHDGVSTIVMPVMFLPKLPCTFCQYIQHSELIALTPTKTYFVRSIKCIIPIWRFIEIEVAQIIHRVFFYKPSSLWGTFISRNHPIYDWE